MEHASAGLLFDPGLGKTSISFAACKVLRNKKVFKGALVVAPLQPCYTVWPKEAERWEDFKGFSVGILHGKHKEEVLFEDHDFYVINYEGLEWLFGRPAPVKPKVKGLSLPEQQKKLQDWDAAIATWRQDDAAVKKRLTRLFSKVDTLILDELSKMKHHDTARFKAVKKYLGKFARRWGLTGSPASKSLMDLFGQAYVLDLGRALGPYITYYRNKYFRPSGFGGYDWELLEGAAEKIYQAVQPLFLRMEAEDYLDMPRIVNVTIPVELPPAARKMYDEMENKLWAEFDEQAFVAVNAASSSTKCAQIAQGALYKDRVDPLTGIPVTGKREWQEIHDAKLVAAENLIAELQGQPILCAYWFGHDLERVLKHRGKNTPHTNRPEREVAKLFDQWNAGQLTELWGQPGSIGHGNNLQEGHACYFLWFNIPWDYELYDQMIRRLRRQGNKSKIIYVYHIIAKDTIDEIKMLDKHNKAMGQKQFLDAIKAYRQRRKK